MNGPLSLAHLCWHRLSTCAAVRHQEHNRLTSFQHHGACKRLWLRLDTHVHVDDTFILDEKSRISRRSKLTVPFQVSQGEKNEPSNEQDSTSPKGLRKVVNTGSGRRSTQVKEFEAAVWTKLSG